MMKKYLLILTALVIVGFLIYVSGLFPYRLFGPFENPPLSVQPNCDQEHRFKFDETIKSENEFIQFLKNHQFEGNLIKYEPTKDKLIPDYISQNPIDLDKLKANVNVETSKAIFSNEKIYSLKIGNQDFNGGWPWMIDIKVSETGHVSIRHCAGI